jgi:hypothetical protein
MGEWSQEVSQPSRGCINGAQSPRPAADALIGSLSLDQEEGLVTPHYVNAPRAIHNDFQEFLAENKALVRLSTRNPPFGDRQCGMTSNASLSYPCSFVAKLLRKKLPRVGTTRASAKGNFAERNSDEVHSPARMKKDGPGRLAQMHFCH